MGDLGNVPPTSSGGAAAAQDDGATVVPTPTAYNFADTGSLQFVVTNVSGVAKVEGNVLAAGGPPTGAAGGDLAGSYPNPTIGTNKVTGAKFRQSAARSVVGVTGNATADVADIAGAGAGTLPIDSGTVLAFGVLTRILQNLSLEGDISPAQITADQNNYNPANLGTAAVVRSSTDAPRNITGLVPGTADGDLKLWINVGSFDETLVSESASSTATNRFTGGDLTLRAGECALLYHDPSTDRWRAVLRSHRPLAGNSTITVTGDSIVVATGGITGNEIAAAIKDPAAGTAGLRTLSTTGTTACAGNDSRLSDSRAPNGAAGGDLTGTYPNPTVGTNKITNGQFRQGAALSVVGVTGNATANVADIAAATDGDILRRKGTALAFGRALPKVVTLTDAATITVDASLIGIGDSFKVTLGGNRTVGVPTNPTDGQWMPIAVFQDGTGSRTLAFTTGAAGFRATELSLTQTLSTTAGKLDYFLFRYNSTDDRWDLMDFRKAA